MRLIDADELVQKWYKMNNINENDKGARYMGFTEIARLINDAPTIEPKIIFMSHRTQKREMKSGGNHG